MGKINFNKQYNIKVEKFKVYLAEKNMKLTQLKKSKFT